jgi:RNA polymerase sigma factor for flagellar operon FliA
VHNQASGQPDPAGREEELVRQYLPLVHHVVSGISARVPRHVAWDDLVSAGMLGLAEAARSFDPARGVPFDGFASMRIRGALLDELRSLDWASRSVRTKARAYDERVNALTVRFGRTPTASEVAAEMGLATGEVQRIVDDVHKAMVVHYDAIGTSGDAEEVLPAQGAVPDEVLLDRERKGYLRDAVKALPERMRFVVESYFFGERLMQDIADELGVTESRVSQIRSEALALLKDGMNSQLDPEKVVEERPEGRVAKRKAAYYAAIASGSDFRGRISIDEPAAPAAAGEATNVVPLRRSVAG